MKKISFLMFFLCSVLLVTAQTKIITGHPDFQVKVTRCVATGTTVILDMLFTNVSETDVEEWGIYSGFYGDFTTVYDSEGNSYDNYKGNYLSFKVGNSNYTNAFRNQKMLSDVPVKVSLKIMGVPETVESLTRVDLVMYIPAFDIGGKTPVKIKNIPISR